MSNKSVLTTDADLAYATTNDQLGMYADLLNYRNNWKRLGFTEDEISDRAPVFSTL